MKPSTKKETLPRKITPRKNSAKDTMVPLQRKPILTKVPSGISGFDIIAQGGLPKGRTTLASGTSGSGKTIFAAQFLHNGIVEQKENGVFVTFEERPGDIMKNMSSFGWDIPKLIKNKKWAFVDASPDESQNEEIGKYDLSGFMIRIQHAIKKVNAKRIAIDSISALFPRYQDAAIIRRELYRLAAKLKEWGITAVMTAERPEEQGTIARFGIEEFVSDNVVLLHNRLTERGYRERTIEILKFRGSSHDSSEAALLVSAVEGMQIFPRPKPVLQGKGFTDKINTGIPGVDKMLYGGVHKNSTTLLSGASGTGKTISALHFIMDGAKKGEKCLMLEFEESPEQLYRNASSFGWNLKKFVDKGTISLICHYPEDLKPEQYLKVIQDIVLEMKPKRFALDSLSALERIYDEKKFREFIIGLNAFLKMNDVTSYLTNTTNELLGMTHITESHLSTTTDNIIVLKYVELGGLIRRMLVVLKARGSPHVKQLAEFEIMKNGFNVLGYYEGVEGLLTGAARYTKPPVDAIEVMSRFDKLRAKLLEKKINQKQYDLEVAKVRKEIEEIQHSGF
jgi:circadian clock protein KaiC